MITLSLFIFNLLPITVLDGGHLLELLLDEFILVLFRAALGRGRKRDDDEPDFVELEELESGSLSQSRSSPPSRDQAAGERRKAKDVLKIVNYCVIGMALLVMADAILGSTG
jgi:membrane-associated protease RseP (regulator of RpoE activity)